jgi:predicted proteasome-type protease
MEQVRRESTGEKRERKVITFQARSQRIWRWAAVGALAASLAVGVLVEQSRNNRRQAEAAEAQLYETLLLVGQKMNQARTEMRGSRPEGVIQ